MFRPDITIIESMVRLFAFALDMDKAWYVKWYICYRDCLLFHYFSHCYRYYYDKFKEYNIKPT